MNIWNCIELFLSLPKSFYVCARLCGLKKAIKLPVLVRYNTVLRRLDGSVSVNYSGGGCGSGFRMEKVHWTGEISGVSWKSAGRL